MTAAALRHVPVGQKILRPLINILPKVGQTQPGTESKSDEDNEGSSHRHLPKLVRPQSVNQLTDSQIDGAIRDPLFLLLRYPAKSAK